MAFDMRATVETWIREWWRNEHQRDFDALLRGGKLTAASLAGAIPSTVAVAWSSITGAPAIPSPSSSVVSETSAGQAAGAGSAATYSRGDHTHGTPSGGGGSGTVSSVGMTVPSDMSVSGSPITTTGTLGLTRNAQSGNKVLASPADGSSGTPDFRAPVAADIPALDAAKITTGQLAAARGGTGVDASGAANGKVLIGNGGGFTLALLSAGANITITNSAGGISIASSGGGGGLTHTYYGYNAIGASFELATTRQIYCKQFTLSAAGTLTGLDVYLKNTVDQYAGIYGFIYEDNSGVPRNMLAGGYGGGVIDMEGSGGATNRPRWYGLSLATYLPAGTYWMAVGFFQNTSMPINIAYDTGGSDRYFTNGSNDLVTDGDYFAQTNSTRNYSMRLSVAT